ncbi:tetratricopeptide repeat protein [Kribbella sp. DT2]|uniref:tetratricopeptide repeat protein n=1 Tax=Kribbella sp. DT2 TaxID=3393427 RepID=UPI003CFA57EF
MDESFATVLRRVRGQRGLTQEALAQQAGLSSQAIGMLERGVRRFPHPATIRKLDAALGLTAEEHELLDRLASRGASTAAPAATTGAPVWAPQPVAAVNAVFSGRTEQLSRLTELLTGGTPQAGVPTVVTIRGMAGVGKTALALQVAAAVSPRYPDGTLSVNLRGFGPGTPLGPLQAIGRLLRRTGVPAEAVPDNVPEAAAALRTRLADRRVLLLLDNARDIVQVADLLPAAADSAVLITSRNTLTTMSANLHLQLDPLDATESADLLVDVAGADRLADSAERIAELCGHLPLALSIAAAWLVAHPSTSADELVRRLDNEAHRLDHLGADDRDVRTSLSHSIDQLVRSSLVTDHHVAEAFTLLGLTDAEDFTPDSAAPLLDLAAAKAGPLLERLTDLHLLESSVPGRYQFHDLVRSYARERAQTLPSRIRDAALDRSLEFHLAIAWRSVELSEPGSARLAWPGRPATPVSPTFTNGDEALSWIDTELSNMLALVDQLSRVAKRGEQLAGLVIGLYAYFTKRGNLADWLPAIDRVATGDPADWTLGQLHADAAIALAELARYDESAERFSLARAHFEAAGSLRGVSMATNNNARLLIRMHRYEEALPLVERALATNLSLGDERAIGTNYATLSEIHLALGRPAAAEAAGDAAQEHLRAAGDTDGVANARIESAWARVIDGRPASAIADVHQSIEELKQLGHRKNVSDAHYVLGLTYRDLRDHEQALQNTERALELAVDAADRRREARSRLLLGQLLLGLGEHDDAIPNLEFAGEFFQDRDSAFANEATEALRAARNGIRA